MALPESVLAKVDFPLLEDVVLPILREALPDVEIGTLVSAEHDSFPYVLVRAHYSTEHWRGEERFFDSGAMTIHVFTSGLDADQDAGLLSEAVRTTLRDAARKRVEVPGVGRLIKATMTTRPRRVADWATSTGPVQYADLPSGATRYETIYSLLWQKPQR